MTRELLEQASVAAFLLRSRPLRAPPHRLRPPRRPSNRHSHRHVSQMTTMLRLQLRRKTKKLIMVRKVPLFEMPFGIIFSLARLKMQIFSKLLTIDLSLSLSLSFTVPNSLEGQITLSNAEYSQEYRDSNSPIYQKFVKDLENEIKSALSLNGNDNDFFVKIIGLK
jgi:hypothetical protein